MSSILNHQYHLNCGLLNEEPFYRGKVLFNPDNNKIYGSEKESDKSLIAVVDFMNDEHVVIYAAVHFKNGRNCANIYQLTNDVATQSSLAAKYEGVVIPAKNPNLFHPELQKSMSFKELKNYFLNEISDVVHKKSLNFEDAQMMLEHI